MFDVAVIGTAEAARDLHELAARAGDLEPVMTSFGRHMMTSIRDNFRAGGRPEKWEDLKGVVVFPKGTKRRNARVAERRRMGGPLVLTGDLSRNIGFEAEPFDLVIGAAPEEDAVKAPVHQYGTDRAGRGHNITIPARPYLMFQEEDIRYFGDLLAGWLRVEMSA